MWVCVCVCEPQIEQKAVAAIGTRTIVLSLDHRHPKTMATPIIEPNLNVDANSHGHWLSIWYTFIHSNCVCVCVSHSIWAHHFQIKWGFCHLFAISESETLLTLLPLYSPFSAYRNMFQCWMMCVSVCISHCNFNVFVYMSNKKLIIWFWLPCPFMFVFNVHLSFTSLWLYNLQ